MSLEQALWNEDDLEKSQFHKEDNHSDVADSCVKYKIYIICLLNGHTNSEIRANEQNVHIHISLVFHVDEYFDHKNRKNYPQNHIVDIFVFDNETSWRIIKKM